MSVDTEKIAKDCINLIAEKIKNLKTLNIIVAGKTGVGKSTLINSVFKDKIATVGVGRPVTQHMRKLSKPGIPLNIYDTKGFELGKNVQEEIKNAIFTTIKNGFASQDINEIIHCIWYCINSTSNRIEDEEIKFLKELSSDQALMNVPIIVVLTQSIAKKNYLEMKKIIENENLNVVQVIPVLAEDYELDDDLVVKSHGLDILIEVMSHALPEELIDTLQNVQIACLNQKKKYAQAAIATATLAAAGEGAAPIPFSDCALLIPTQVSMIVSITVIFGFDVNKSIIAALLSSTIGSSGATLLGKTIVANIAKLIPGAGTVAGGAISSATASVITAALGEAYIGIMELVFKGEMDISDLNTKEGKEKMSKMFKHQLSIKR